MVNAFCATAMLAMCTTLGEFSKKRLTVASSSGNRSATEGSGALSFCVGGVPSHGLRMPSRNTGRVGVFSPGDQDTGRVGASAATPPMTTTGRWGSDTPAYCSSHADAATEAASRSPRNAVRMAVCGEVHARCGADVQHLEGGGESAHHFHEGGGRVAQAGKGGAQPAGVHGWSRGGRLGGGGALAAGNGADVSKGRVLGGHMGVPSMHAPGVWGSPLRASW